MPDRPCVTREQLKDIFEYDSETGHLIYRVSRSKIKHGTVAGSLNKDGYREVKVFGRTYLEHRVIWLYHYGEFPNQFIDHINRAKSDNRIENLREATRGENSQNMPETNPFNKKSGYRGVIWIEKTKRWTARITVDGKAMGFGHYKNVDDAIKARRDAVRLHCPFAPKESA